MPTADEKGTWIALKRGFFINYYRLTSLPASWKDWCLRTLAYSLVLAPPVIFLWQKRHDLSMLYVVVSVAGVMLNGYLKLKPEFANRFFYITTGTNIEIAAVIRSAYNEMKTGGDRKELQQRLLVVIAAYVRSLRHDVKGTKIYANLLILSKSDSERVIVLGRSHPLVAGDERAEHKLDQMAVRQCFVLGTSKEVGDIWVEFPKTDRTKRYRSILGIPLKSVMSATPQVLGVLSIDSSEPYHFAKWEKQLINVLRPLLTLLELTLERSR